MNQKAANEVVPLRIGIAGLGTASNLVLPYTRNLEGLRLTAAADIRETAREAFRRDYGLPAYASVEALCDSGEIDAVWIETPNQFHCEHVLAAAKRCKHVICAKPLAATLDECNRMIAACRLAGVRLLVGHSKIFDSPVRAIAEIVRSGRLGRVLKIDTWWFNDWLRRPRLASELDETRGAGFILRQAPHLVDIAAYLAAAPAVSVRAFINPADVGIYAGGGAAGDGGGKGLCTAMIRFASGAVASFTLSGYGYFESRELTWNIGVFGGQSTPGKPLPLHPPLTEEEKFTDSQPGTANRTAQGALPFVGLTIVSCERGVIRQSPDGIYLYTDDGRSEEPIPPNPGRAAELIELRDAICEGRDVFPNGEWGRANLEICLAILRSAREGRDVAINR